MKSNKISAKDRAFAKERLQFHRSIKAIEQQLHQKDALISKQTDTIHKLNDKIRTQQEWIDRLLEYMDMTSDDLNTMKTHIRLQKAAKSTMNDIFRNITNYSIHTEISADMSEWYEVSSVTTTESAELDNTDTQ